jgi:acyl carrier protein
MTTLHDAITRWLNERCGVRPAGYEGDAALFSNGMLDSFDLLDLVVMLEKSNGRKISAIDINLENFDTPNRIVRFMSR